jgi:hypothetical protein
MTNSRSIVPDFELSGLNALAQRASDAYETLFKALPRDETGEVEAMAFLRSQQLQARAWFREIR